MSKTNGLKLEFSLTTLYDEIGHKFKTPSLLIQALKDPTSKNNKFIDKDDNAKTYLATKNNKLLAFYGDLAIYGVIGQILQGTYSFNKGDKEEYTFYRNRGELSEKRKRLSKNDVFDNLFRESDFAKKYLLSDPLCKLGEKAYANLFEAIIGAVAIDTNWDYHVIIKVYKKLFYNYKDSLHDDKDYYNLLKDITKENCLNIINSLKTNKDIKKPLISDFGMEDDLFIFQYEIPHIGKAIGEGKSKKEAKRNACYKVIKDFLSRNQKMQGN